MRLIPVMLALLLALSPGAVALQVSAPTAPSSQSTQATSTPTEQTVLAASNGNTTTVLTLGTAPARTAFDSPSLALGSSLAMNRGEFQTELSVGTLDQQLSAAETSEKRKHVLNRYRYRIENRIISLKAEEKQVTQAFSNGSISARDYVHALARIDSEAEELRKSIEAMRQRAEEIPKFGLDNEAEALKAKLVPLEGPIRDRIGKAIQGKTSATKIYVATADTGIVLSTIIRGTYVREVERVDHRDSSATGQMTLEEAETAIIDDQYPWIASEKKGTNHWVYGSINALRLTYYHSHGNLTAYVDMGTEQIYREIQYKQLNGQQSLPAGPAVANASQNVTLTVNRTYPGGPLRVKLTNETGAPLDGRITVAGEPVGRTHGDGILWTLGPAEQFQVSATYEDTTVNVTATPVKPDS